MGILRRSKSYAHHRGHAEELDGNNTAHGVHSGAWESIPCRVVQVSELQRHCRLGTCDDESVAVALFETFKK